MRWLAWPLAFSLTLVGQEPSPSEIPAFARDLPVIRSGSPVFAFNGKDLTGFTTYTRFHHQADPAKVFGVRDGMLRISGEEFGGLATVESFSNYHLVVEWKWGGETYRPRRFQARNSGVLVHGVGPEGDAFASWLASFECQILEGGSGDLIVVPGKSNQPSLTSEIRPGGDGQSYYQKGGRAKTLKAGRFNWWGRDPSWKDVAWYRGRLDVDQPVGEWNRMEVVCDGDAISYRLNGVLMNAANAASWTSGKIQFQSEGAEILFRKIEVRPLLR